MTDFHESTDEAGDAKRIGSGVDLRDAFYALGLVTLAVAVLVLARDLLAPIALAILLWFLVNAVADFLRRLWLPQGLALTLSAALTLTAMFFVGQLVVNAIGQIDVQGALSTLDRRMSAAVASLQSLIGVELDYDIRKLSQFFSIEPILSGIVSSVTTAASNFALILLFVLFLLLDQPYYEMKLKALFPNRDKQGRVRRVLRKIGEDTRIYIWLMTLVSVAVGLITYLIAASFKLEGAAFWGFLAFALNYIPTIGSFLGVLFPAAFALVKFEEFETTLVFVGLLGVVQFVAGNVVLPRLMGDRLNLSQFVVILSLSVWSAMWGTPGLFLAVPLMMILAIVLSQFDSTRAVAILMSKRGRVMGR